MMAGNEVGKMAGFIKDGGSYKKVLASWRYLRLSSGQEIMHTGKTGISFDSTTGRFSLLLPVEISRTLSFTKGLIAHPDKRVLEDIADQVSVRYKALVYTRGLRERKSKSCTAWGVISLALSLSFGLTAGIFPFGKNVTQVIWVTGIGFFTLGCALFAVAYYCRTKKSKEEIFQEYKMRALEKYIQVHCSFPAN